MDHEFIITDESGEERRIAAIRHPEWERMDEPCPECGEHEFRHFSSDGGQYGAHGGTVILRSDYWDTNRELFTQCLGCDAVLYKHPAYDLLYQREDSGDSIVSI
jgi:hypothetical protein